MFSKKLVLLYFGRTPFTVLFCFFFISSYTQLDTIHYFPPFHTSGDSGSQYFFVSTPSQATINVNVSTGDGTFIGSLLVSNANPSQYFIGDDNSTRAMINKSQLNTVLDDKGYIFSSTSPFYCNYRILTNNGDHSGSVTCKGAIAKGRRFRPGHMITSNSFSRKSNTISIIAVEESDVFVSNISPSLDVEDYGFAGGGIRVHLEVGESYVFSAHYFLLDRNERDGFFGSLIESSGDIVVNCGSMTGGTSILGFSDIGIDQIVPMEALGTEYICIQGNGLLNMEFVMLMIDVNGTEISVNGVPQGTYNAGEFVILNEGYFSNRENMYIQSTERIATYQMLGGSFGAWSFGMNFIPPINCLGDNFVDNIPYYNSIDNLIFDGNIVIVGRTGFPVRINGVPLDVNLAQRVTGNPEYVTYKINATVATDHIVVTSDVNIQVGLMGANNAIGFASYFSGFEKFPVAAIASLDSINGFCLDSLEVKGLFDQIEWYYKDSLVANNVDQIETLGAGEYYALVYFAQCPEFKDTSFIYIHPEPDTVFIVRETCFPQDTGHFVHILESAKRCDSLVYEEVKLLRRDFIYDSLYTCFIDEVNQDTFVMQNTDGCDSTVYQTTQLARRDTLVEYNYVCDITQVRSDTTFLVNSFGCDSLRVDSFHYVGLDTFAREETICQGESYLFEGALLEDNGLYCFTYPSAFNCDSIQCLSLNVTPIFDTLTIDTICSYETLIFEGDTLFATGNYEYKYNAVEYCDSTIRLNLVVTEEPELSFSALAPYCQGDSLTINVTKDIEVNFIWDDGFPRVNRSFRSGGMFNYEYMIKGCLYSDNIEIPEPTNIAISIEDISDFNGYQVSCFGASDGSVTIALEGGNEPYFIRWDSNNQGKERIGLTADYYVVKVSDRFGCTDSLGILIEEPSPIEIQYFVQDIDCNFDLGRMEIVDITGAVPDYSIIFNSVESVDNVWNDLLPGNYNLSIEDENDCLYEEEIPVRNLGDTLYLNILGPDTVYLGQFANFNYASSEDLIQWEWSSEQGDTCQNCDLYTLFPTEDKRIQLTGNDDKGCYTTVWKDVVIVNRRAVFIPNSFSPNGDAKNDNFVVFADVSVDKVTKYQIFNRWGDLVFENSNFQPNVEGGFWDGSFRGKFLNPDVFVYLIEVAYIDGSSQVFYGDITLRR